MRLKIRKLFSILTVICVFFFLINFNFSLNPILNKYEEKLLVSSKRYEVDCELLIAKDDDEIKQAAYLLQDSERLARLSDANLIFSKDMCPAFRKVRGYDEYQVHSDELEFPLAFSILTYNDAEQFERLLRVIYRPHNIYCIHVDLKSAKEFREAIESITNCFENVFIASKIEEIVYAGFSRLQADLNCMSDLLMQTKVKWKYLFNLASTEFPLKTNYEMVKILKLYNGANDIEVINKYFKSRLGFKWKVENGSMVKTNVTKEKPPHDLVLMKGLAYGVFSRAFIDYTINSRVAKDLLEYLRDTFSPDET